jgi:hypothetical protein
MARRAAHGPGGREATTGFFDDVSLPRPTLRFRLRAWRAFQRALDPLGPGKPLRPPRRH